MSGHNMFLVSPYSHIKLTMFFFLYLFYVGSYTSDIDAQEMYVCISNKVKISRYLEKHLNIHYLFEIEQQLQP